METKLPIFVYGTLLPGWENYERHVLPYPHQTIAAQVQGELFHLPMGYPGLLAGQQTVKGSVLLFDPAEYAKALAELDELETYYGPGDPRNEYERVAVMAKLTEEGREIPVYAYRYVDEKFVRTEGTPVDGGDWQRYMQGRQPE